MAKALSIDLRERVVVAVDGGLSRRQAAERFAISAASAVRWLQRQKTYGSVEPAKQGGDRKTRAASRRMPRSSSPRSKKRQTTRSASCKRS